MEQKEGQIKLLEVKSTNEKANKKNQNKELKAMLQEKLSLLEGDAPSGAVISPENPNIKEEQLMVKLQKIFKNGDIDNKEKIKQMNTFFYDEVIQHYEDVVNGVSHEAAEGLI